MYAKSCQTMIGIAIATPAKSDTRMYVAKPSVGASVMHDCRPDGSRRMRMSVSANVNAIAVMTATPIAAKNRRRRSSSRCSMSESSRSRAVVTTTA